MATEGNQGTIAGAIALAILDQGEALHATTVALQAQVRKELGEAQAVLRQESAALQASFREDAFATLTILRQETEALKTLRREVQRSVEELAALQPGIERSAAAGIRNELTAGSAELRRDLREQLSGSVGQLGDAAREVKGMVQRLTPLWASLIAGISLLLGILLMYFFVAAGQRRIEGKIDRMQQAAPAQMQAPAVATPAAVAGRAHPKTHGSKATAGPKIQAEPVPAPPTTDQP